MSNNLTSPDKKLCPNCGDYFHPKGFSKHSLGCFCKPYISILYHIAPVLPQRRLFPRSPRALLPPPTFLGVCLYIFVIYPFLWNLICIGYDFVYPSVASVAAKGSHAAWLAGLSFSTLAKLQAKLTAHTQELFQSLVPEHDTSTSDGTKTPDDLKAYIGAQFESLDTQADGAAERFVAFAKKHLGKLEGYLGEKFELREKSTFEWPVYLSKTLSNPKYPI